MTDKLKLIYRHDLLIKKVINKLLYYYRWKKDINYWNTLKNKYQGRRGFVIGNGPSLKIEDLTTLHDNNEITIASNKIYLAFNHTKWRPNFFSIADPLLWEKVKYSIHEDIPIVHIPTYLDASQCNKKTRYWYSRKNDFTESLKNISDNIAFGACCGSTVTYENIQIAIHLGLNPIYIIGCDHFYAGEDNVEAGEIIRQSENKSHFISGYREPGEQVHAAPIDKMNSAFRIAKLYINTKGIKIYNATRGGQLDIFERMNLDDLL